MGRMPRGRRPAITDRDPVWVVTVDYHGELLRWSSRVVDWDLADAGGSLVEMVGSWTPPDELRLAEDVSLTVDVRFPAAIPLAARELAGRATLAGCAVEVAWLPTLGAWEDRFVALQGYVDGPRVGAPEEPVVFGVVPATLREDTNRLPHPSHTVTSTTWPTAPDASIGLTYPIVYGQPGRYLIDGEEVFHNGSPAIVVETATEPSDDDPSVDLELSNRLLVHWRAVPDGTRVFVRWQDTDTGSIWYSKAFDVDRSEDGLGQLCSTVDISGETQSVRKVTSFAVSWRDPVDDRVSAADIVEWWLAQSTADFDRLRTREGLAALHGLRLSGYTNAPITGVDWVTDRLVDFPVRFVDGPNGRYLAAVAWQVDARTAVARIEVVSTVAGERTTGAVRTSPIRVEGTAPTEVRVSWAPKLTGDGRVITTRTIDGRIRVENQIGITTPTGTAQSATGTAVQLVDVWDEATAAYVARYVAWRDGRTQRTVTVKLPTDAWSWLREGDVVLYTDDSLGVTDVVAVVQTPAITTAAAMTVELAFG